MSRSVTLLYRWVNPSVYIRLPSPLKFFIIIFIFIFSFFQKIPKYFVTYVKLFPQRVSDTRPWLQHCHVTHIKIRVVLQTSLLLDRSQSLLLFSSSSRLASMRSLPRIGMTESVSPVGSTRRSYIWMNRLRWDLFRNVIKAVSADLRPVDVGMKLKKVLGKLQARVNRLRKCPFLGLDRCTEGDLVFVISAFRNSTALLAEP